MPALFPLTEAGCRDKTEQTEQAALPCTLTDYLDLVEWTGRQWRDDKRGALAPGARSVLVDLGIAPNEWFHTVHKVRRGFAFAIAAIEALQLWRDKLQQRWVKGAG